MFIQLEPTASERDRSAYAIQQTLRPVLTEFPNYRATFVQDQGGSSGSDITVQFVGQDPAAVNAPPNVSPPRCGAFPTLTDVRSTLGAAAPGNPDSSAPRRHGAASASPPPASPRPCASPPAATSSRILPKFDLADRQIPIRVTLRPDSRTDLDAIRSLPGAIEHRRAGAPRRRRRRLLRARRSHDRAARPRARRHRRRQRVPGGICRPRSMPCSRCPKRRIHPPASASPPRARPRTSRRCSPAFGTAMLWGVILIYGVLVLLFRDFFQPITIMTALPLSIGGAFLGLIIANQPLSLFALIGLLMLMGLVTKNSILLVDFADRADAQRHEPQRRRSWKPA